MCLENYHFLKLRCFVDCSFSRTIPIAPHSLLPLVYDACTACHSDFFEFERLATVQPTVVIFVRMLIIPRSMNRHVFPSVRQIIVAARLLAAAANDDLDLAREGVVSSGIFQFFNNSRHFPSLQRVDVLGTDVLAGSTRDVFLQGWITKMQENGIQLRSHPQKFITIDTWPAP